MAAFKELRTALGLRSPKRGDPHLHTKVGRHTYGVKKSTFLFERHDSDVRIGAFCSFAPEVKIHASSEHPQAVTTYPLHRFCGEKRSFSVAKGPVIIGNDVWIGHRATILSGITIGDGAIIGAGSVVTKDVAPYSVTAGNPASHIRFRFEPEIISELLELKWWDWPEEKIVRLHRYLEGDVMEFLRVVRAEA